MAGSFETTDQNPEHLLKPLRVPTRHEDIYQAAQELVDEIAIRAVQLDSVEPGLLRVLRSMAIIRDDARDLVEVERACLFVILSPFESMRMARRPGCACDPRCAGTPA